MNESTPAATRITRVFAAITDPAARRILVVDDEESIRLALGKFLRSRGYDVTTVVDGEGALNALQADRFDAMLCDIRMPGMSGIEVVARALEFRPELAVLMLTAVTDAPTATEALAQGAMDYLMKPVELADLARAIERALQKRDLELQQRNIERVIREEVDAHSAELNRELRLLAETVDVLAPRAGIELDSTVREILCRILPDRRS